MVVNLKINYLLSVISEILNLQSSDDNFNGVEINALCIDSRELTFYDGVLFFAIKGQYTDGHEYIDELVNKGVKYFVVSEDYKYEGNKNPVLLKSKSPLESFQKLAAHHREKFDIPIIGITGSYGKTISKELLFQSLSHSYNCVRSPKSYNSQTGVPLSIFQIDNSHNMGIFEAGISKVFEMDRLEEIIKPTIGIFTSIGDAHSSGFKNLSEKIGEKLSLFKNCKIIFLNNSSHIREITKVKFENKEIRYWDFNNSEAYLNVTSFENHKGHFKVKTICENQKQDYKIPFDDRANFENSLLCIMILNYLGVEYNLISERIEKLIPVNNRLDIKEGINDCTLIWDYQNIDLQSFSIALSFLDKQMNKDKSIIISEFDETNNPNGKEDYEKLYETLRNRKFKNIIAVGEKLKTLKSLDDNVKYYQSTSDLIKDFDNLDFSEESILVKGAKKYNFQSIIPFLERSSHSAIFEINMANLVNNLNYFRSVIKRETKLMVVLKASAYGAGAVKIAELMQHYGVDYIAVAYASEGVELRKNEISMPIVVLNTEESSFHDLVKYRLEPVIYSLRVFEKLQKFLFSIDSNELSCHLEINSGLNRLGVKCETIELIAENYKSQSKIKIDTIFTHLGSSEEEQHDDYTLGQFETFESMVQIWKKSTNENPICHALNTYGIIRHSKFQYDMVRLGIGIFGIGKKSSLKPVFTLKAKILHINNIEENNWVGYSQKFVSSKSMKVATVGIGYADGIPVSASNKVCFNLNGKKIEQIGQICMDVLMVDVSNVDCQIGDYVEVFGEKNNVEELTNSADTIVYSIFSGISRRIKRVFYWN